MSTVSQANWEAFVALMYGLADTLNCPLVDIYRRWGTNAAAITNGLVGADNNHPNAVAQADLGQLTWRGVCAALIG